MRAKFVHCAGTTTMDEEHTTPNETNATSGVSLFDPSFTPQRFLALIKLWKRLPLIEAIVQFASIPAALAVFGLPRSGGDVVILILAILLWCYVVHLSRNIFLHSYILHPLRGFAHRWGFVEGVAPNKLTLSPEELAFLYRVHAVAKGQDREIAAALIHANRNLSEPLQNSTN